MKCACVRSKGRNEGTLSSIVAVRSLLAQQWECQGGDVMWYAGAYLNWKKIIKKFIYNSGLIQGSDLFQLFVQFDFGLQLMEILTSVLQIILVLNRSLIEMFCDGLRDPGEETPSTKSTKHETAG